MRIDRVHQLLAFDIANCDFSFEINQEMEPPYENPFEQVVSVVPYRKAYTFVAEDFQFAPDETKRILLVASENDLVCGYLLASRSWNNYAQIDDFAVDSVARRKGIGRLLMDEVVHWAHRQNLPGLRLETQSNNVAACRFYYRYGFRLGGFDTRLYTALESARHEIALFWYLFL